MNCFISAPSLVPIICNSNQIKEDKIIYYIIQIQVYDFWCIILDRVLQTCFFQYPC